MGLTDFQTLAEISESQPFYFMVVAHESRNLFADANVAKKILDRFESPVKIELPENMAFKLMAQAMRVTSDSALKAEWASDKADLNLELRGAACGYDSDISLYATRCRSVSLQGSLI